jgi:hypothetical protein
MAELGEGPKVEIPYSPEKPRNVEPVALPNIDVRGKTIRLGMHTDSILTLLKTLGNQPDLDQLKVEGRVLTPEQGKSLANDPTYLFYLSGRTTRATGEQGYIFLLPKNMNLKQEEVAALLQTPFTPAVLSKKIGYKTGYYSAKSLISELQSSGNVAKLLPIIGATNEFNIGSDTLNTERLSEISQEIMQAFKDQEALILQAMLSSKIINTFMNYNLGSIGLRSSAPALLDVQPPIAHPGQVRNISEIVVGETYVEMHDGQKGTSKIKILGSPYQDQGGDWWADVETTYKDGFIYKDKISMADGGIVPYTGSGRALWNPSNCLIKETSDSKKDK